MGFSDFQMQAEAVAYMGFAGTLLPGDAYQPIALCEQTLLNEADEYSCNTGRMISSSPGKTTFNTGAFTNYTQKPCATASANSIRPYVGCSAAPSPELTLGIDMGTTGGQVQTVLGRFLRLLEDNRRQR